MCVELPLNNTKGPVETTGVACKLSDNGSGNGDSDGGGNTPDEGVLVLNRLMAGLILSL